MGYRWPDLSWLDAEGSPLPADFLWGVANAGFQVEGGYNGAGEPRNNWAEWERRGRAAPAGRAVDFWHGAERHLDLAAAIGLNAFRLSLEWARLEPRPGELDAGALARYAGILRACRERGLEPVVTLHHFTHPAWLGPDPWLDGSGPPAFEAHVSRLVPAITERLDRPVRWWITTNEPNIFAFSTHALGALPRRARPSPRTFRRALDQLLLAHVLAYRAIHRAHGATGWARPSVSYNTYCLTAYGLDRAPMDIGLARGRGLSGARLRDFLRQRRDAFERAVAPLRGRAAILADRWLERVLLPDPVAGLPSYVDALSRGDGPAHDHVALDYYVGPLAHYLRLPFTGDWRGRRNLFVAELWETTIRPEGLRLFLQAHTTPERMPILVAENGMATRGPAGSSRPRPDGWTRPAFLRAHVAELLAAARAGAPVAGYLHWTLADNYEWGSFEPRFGLHGVDRTGPEPAILPTDAAGLDSAAAYARIVEALRHGTGADALAVLADLSR
jgi:beta-glucosidase